MQNNQNGFASIVKQVIPRLNAALSLYNKD